MKRKSAAEIFREVDPELTVIRGGIHRRKKETGIVNLGEQREPELPHYEPHKATDEEWEAAGGVKCPNCGNETMRLINGLCPQCARAVEAETDRQIEVRAMRNYYQDKRNRGTLNLRRMRQGFL